MTIRLLLADDQALLRGALAACSPWRETSTWSGRPSTDSGPSIASVPWGRTSSSWTSTARHGRHHGDRADLRSAGANTS